MNALLTNPELGSNWILVYGENGVELVIFKELLRAPFFLECRFRAFLFHCAISHRLVGGCLGVLGFPFTFFRHRYLQCRQCTCLKPPKASYSFADLLLLRNGVIAKTPVGDHCANVETLVDVLQINSFL